MSVVDQIILLHDVDSKLFEINKLLGGLPGQVEELTTQEENLKNSLVEKEELLKKTTVDIETSENIIATSQEKINTLKDKLTDGSISTNKEYDAMMETIDYEKNLVSEKETELLRLMETKDTLSKEIEEDKSNLDTLIQDLASKKEALESKLSEVSDEKSSLEEERNNIIKNIDDSILAQYQTIYEARNGVAVAEILDDSCGECGSFIPAQLVNEALAKHVVFCGN
ncbi:MAG: hypothetical protein VYE63_02390, partial [Candidatus Neomarinimicrobiota bacterium]|nr:hypothetical protein [Candidatus Neomarinimicrobiota bacterium]